MLQRPKGNLARSAKSVALLTLAASICCGVIQAQDTPDFFRKNCMNCHTIGGGRLAGPDLKDVTVRAQAAGKDRVWLVEFMMDPKAKIDGGDPYAVKLLETYRAPMPTLAGMTKQRAEYLLELIEAESKLEESQFKGLQISNKPFLQKDRDLGKAIFLGQTRLEKGGTACIACHSMHDISTLGGGHLGPDLTNVYERGKLNLKDRKALSGWLVAPSSETMQPIFKDHALTADEIHAVAAYLDAAAGERPAEPAASRVAFLLMGLILAAAIVFGFDAIWKRRFHSVRRPLVDTTPVHK